MSSSKDNQTIIEGEIVTGVQDDALSADKLVTMFKIKTQLPVIKENFEQVKSYVLSHLKTFEIEVTEDNLEMAKKLTTTLNQLSIKADEARKDTVQTISQPIDQFNAQCKALISLIQEKRTFLLNQVEVFNARTRKECLDLLVSALKNAYEKYGVKQEFQNAKIDDLAIVSNKTQSGISAKARNTVEARALDCKRFQEKVELRLNTLVGDCLSAGLEAPLVRQNIENFLKVEDDALYQQKLQSLIQSEIKRLANLKQRLEDTAKKEAEAKAKAELQNSQQLVHTTSQAACANQPTENTLQRPTINAVKPTGNQKTYVVTAVFEVTVDEAMAPKLGAFLLRKFETASFKTIPTITVSEKGALGAQNIDNARKDIREAGSLF